MGFNFVYRTLVELFPQVDQRILKAVAIEHPQEADAAAEVVISEILPSLAQQSISGPPLFDDYKPSGLSPVGRAELHTPSSSKSNSIAMGKAVVSSPFESRSINEHIPKTYVGSSSSSCQQDTPNLNSTEEVSFDLNAVGNLLQGSLDSEELILLKRPQFQDSVECVSHTNKYKPDNSSVEGITDHSRTEADILSSLAKCQDDNFSNVDQEFGGFDDNKDLDHPSFVDLEAHAERKSPQAEQMVESQERSKVESYIDGAESSLVYACIDGGERIDSYCNGTDLEVAPVTGEVHFQDSSSPTNICKNLAINGTDLEVAPVTGEVYFQSEVSSCPTNSARNLAISQNTNIDFLEDIVEAAKNNKKTLFLAMQSIVNMMREVELQEKAAEEAKEEASNAGLDILRNVEEIKQMLPHARAANDMHSGEVYGEKAILSTEVKELQARLVSLSDERDNALAIIDEMRQSLEDRLAAAEELKKSAEKHKLEREEAARVALAEQQAIMDKVVKESKILQEAANENAKLREFLMDRGRVVDTLQGEMSVIFQDVRELKEKFDARLPLSKSISSSQTSCILASSGSGISFRSSGSDMVIEARDTSEIPKERSPISSVCGPVGSPAERSPASSPKKINGEMELLEDDWEVCDPELSG